MFILIVHDFFFFSFELAFVFDSSDHSDGFQAVLFPIIIEVSLNVNGKNWFKNLSNLDIHIYYS